MDPDPAQLSYLMLLTGPSQLFYLGIFIALLLGSALISGAEVILSDAWFSNIETTELKIFLEIVVVTFLILLFGEIFPKVYANRNSVAFANFMAVPLNVLDKLFSFLSLPMRYVTLKIQDSLGSKKAGLTVSHLIPLVIDHGYSRIPVFKESIDQITGVLYVKDLLPYIDRKNYEWTKLLREAYFINLDDEQLELYDSHKGESETIAGFLLEQTGAFPRKLDKISFYGFTFLVESMDKKRIKQVKCTLP